MEKEKQEKSTLSRVTSFGLGLVCSSITTSAVTMTYAIAYDIPGFRTGSFDVPMFTMFGIAVIGAGVMRTGMPKPRRHDSREQANPTAPKP